MKTHMLQAVLTDQSVTNIDFLENLSNSLIAIDRYTNAYDFWSFQKILEDHLEEIDSQTIAYFQIAIPGKEYAYSVCFQNQYLAPILEEKITVSRNQIEVSKNSNAFQEMKNFLFSDLDSEQGQLIERYSYRNRFSRLIYKYKESYSDCEEDRVQKQELKKEIIQEMSKYQTYRSLCLYRKRLERVPFRRESTKKIVPVLTSTSSVPRVLIPDNPTVIEDPKSMCPLVWENDCGDEREEFLEPEDMKRMVKSYGEN